MQKKSHLRALCLLVTLTFALSGCLTGKYKPVADMGNLEVSFADSLWNGQKVPAGQQCNRFGGKGSTPQLMVKNIPPNANALIMEYSDSDYMPMDNGGHGKMGYKIFASSNQVTIPSVQGHTFDLPEDFFLVSAHNNPSWDILVAMETVTMSLSRQSMTRRRAKNLSCSAKAS